MNTWLAKLGLTALTAAALLLPSASTYASSKLYVDDDKVECPTASFSSIQAAVDAAPSGAEIRVCPGTYNESVTITKKLTLRNQTVNGKSAPLIEVQGADQAILVSSTKDVTIRGLRIIATPSKNGVIVEGSTNVTVRDMTIDTTRSAIAFQDGSNKGNARDNTITGTSFIGITALNSNQVKVEKNTITGGLEGIHVQGADKTQVTKNTVTQMSNGIELLSATNTTVSGNTTNFNQFGVRMGHSTKNSFQDGTAKGNSVNGILIDPYSSDNVVKDYTALDNGELDASDFTSGSKTAGTANTWKDNKCVTSDPAGLCKK